MQRVWTLVYGLCLLGMAACSEDTAGEGEACEAAQDCDGSLVCARVAPGADEFVCAKASDTRADNDCEREYENMICGPVLKQAPDAGM